MSVVDLIGFTDSEKLKILKQDIAERRESLREWNLLIPKMSLPNQDVIYDTIDQEKKALRESMRDMVVLKRRIREKSEMVVDL